MKEIGFDELRTLQLEMMCKIDGFCRENGINYSLTYGTLLGAIRHKGYIPWDDDIDIAMPRPDYNKFIKTFNGNVDHLSVISPELNPGYYAPYANVFDDRTLLLEGANSHRGIEIGVKIDVFPVDGVPDDENDYHQFMGKLKKLNGILVTKRYPIRFSDVKSFLIDVIFKSKSLFLTYSSVQRRIIKVASSYPFESSSKVDFCTFPIYKDSWLNRSVYDEYIDVLFEGHTFRAVKEYAVFLRQMYRNYMELPPKEKRVARHGFTAYWK